MMDAQMRNKSITSLSLLLLITACSNDITPVTHQHKNAQSNTTPQVKNVILMIGDGMGASQVGLLEEYAQRAPDSIYNSRGNKSALAQFVEQGQIGLSMTAPLGLEGSLVVDSACSATQLATGMASGSEMIGLDEQGNVVSTILERAKRQGKATGLVSDTRITHATPAAFATHQPHRSFETGIAAQLIDSGNVDVMLSGGIREFIPTNSDASALSATLNWQRGCR